MQQTRDTQPEEGMALDALFYRLHHQIMQQRTNRSLRLALWLRNLSGCGWNGHFMQDARAIEIRKAFASLSIKSGHDDAFSVHRTQG